MINNLDYPNPVLSTDRDDYMEGCIFDASFDESRITVDEEFINIPASYELVSDGLTECIKTERAIVVVLVYSSATMYRSTYSFASGSNELLVRVPKFSVKDSIEFSSFILANENIDHFKLEEFNELYFQGISFSIKKADVLAKGLVRTIPVDDSELEKPISSIFSIQNNEGAEIDIEADFDSDHKIIIRICGELNRLYWEMKDHNSGALRRYLTGIIVYPVLVEAISKMVDTYRNISDYSNKRWFRTIEHKLQSLELDISQDQEKYSFTELADRLLGGIAKDGLRSVKDTLDSELNSGEYTQIGGVD